MPLGKPLLQVEQVAFDLAQQLFGYRNLDAVAGGEVAHQGGEFAPFFLPLGAGFLPLLGAPPWGWAQQVRRRAMDWLTRAASRSSTRQFGGGEGARAAGDEERVPRGAGRAGAEAQFVDFGGVQGLRAAAPCRACNERCDDEQRIRWDPVTMRMG